MKEKMTIKEQAHAHRLNRAKELMRDTGEIECADGVWRNPEKMTARETLRAHREILRALRARRGSKGETS